ncbi:MAG: phosphoribosylformylglycinamidine cyclo-ligase [Candidatus Syntrophonatronum acetioxidans]|uniref:Phosphoribosylformylglycinamidine cyclo-ligase n=1 Tax=Candidatus Syntrophonatronum acetioxidans TaxID=1795816 RepID=A0A424YDW3_9FIRM|nr:MAG: phosphoribosylformylglycinamidine cyclo-ligase [Candidatus Syntrophonatronum acetioxidans]
MNEEMDYKKSGVDIDAANKAVDLMKNMVKKTFREEVLTDIGGFGGLFALNVEKYKKPVLVSSTDGVGTKLKLAFLTGIHHTVGIDLVAMCVNDIAVLGAEPLFFLDYLAVGRLEPEKVADIVSGIAEGCKEAGCALIGGETAEMPDFYKPGEYDMAGFSVGIVDRERIIQGERITPGDKVIGIASSGLHSNGYSLVRKVFLEKEGLDLESYMPQLGCSLGEELLRPTSIYARLLLKLKENHDLKGMVHITGGGFYENIPRILPGSTGVVIDKSWDMPPIFSLLQEMGNINIREMYRTFNMGVGMVVIAPSGEEKGLLSTISEEGFKGWLLGEVVEGKGQVEINL